MHKYDKDSNIRIVIDLKSGADKDLVLNSIAYLNEREDIIIIRKDINNFDI